VPVRPQDAPPRSPGVLDALAAVEHRLLWLAPAVVEPDLGVGGLDERVGQVVLEGRLDRCPVFDGSIPTNAQAEYWAILEVPKDLEPGLDAVTHVRTKIDDFARRWAPPTPRREEQGSSWPHSRVRPARVGHGTMCRRDEAGAGPGPY